MGYGETGCTGTYAYFDKICDASGGAGCPPSGTCTADADCGTGNLCGGRLVAGTGVGYSYSARRCMTFASSTKEDLVRDWLGA